MKNTLYILALLCFFINVNAQSDLSSSQQFWDQLSKHCGKTYEGQITEGGKEGDGFTGERLIMHMLKCDDNQILIPFNVGENLSRTWILTKDENGYIQLKHDHRKEDGSNDPITMYGGTTANLGSKNAQYFPADQETRELIPYAAANIWWITIDDDYYTYNLKRVGTDRVFKVSFDLNVELPKPKASWGW